MMTNRQDTNAVAAIAWSVAFVVCLMNQVCRLDLWLSVLIYLIMVFLSTMVYSYIVEEKYGSEGEQRDDLVH